MAPRGKRGTTGAVQSHADLTCWVCGGEADVDDSPWLCLCTTEERRVHKACATQRLHAGTEPTPCVHCGMSNQYKPISSARSRARVVVIGAGPAGLGAAKWLRERGLEPVVLEASLDPRCGGVRWTPQVGLLALDDSDYLIIASRVGKGLSIVLGLGKRCRGKAFFLRWNGRSRISGRNI